LNVLDKVKIIVLTANIDIIFETDHQIRQKNATIKYFFIFEHSFHYLLQVDGTYFCNLRFAI